MAENGMSFQLCVVEYAGGNSSGPIAGPTEFAPCLDESLGSKEVQYPMEGE